eukprot:2044309-Rhodomonas_salina.2
MLDKKATEITDESVGLFESEQEDRTQSLHAESAPLVQMWEERLVELRRIRNEILVRAASACASVRASAWAYKPATRLLRHRRYLLAHAAYAVTRSSRGCRPRSR